MSERRKLEEEESAPRPNPSVPTFDEDLGGHFVCDRRNQTERGKEQMRKLERVSGVKRSGSNREIEEGEPWEGASKRFKTVIVRDPELNHQKRYDIVRKVQGRKRKSRTSGGIQAAKKRKRAAESRTSSFRGSTESINDLRDLLTPRIPLSNVTPPATPTRRPPTSPRRSQPPSRPAIPSSINPSPSTGAIQKTAYVRRSPSPQHVRDINSFAPEGYVVEERLKATWKICCHRFRQYCFAKRRVDHHTRVNTMDLADWIDNQFGKYKDENRKLAREAFASAHRQHVDEHQAEKAKKKLQDQRGRERSALATLHREVVDANVDHLRQRDER